MRILKAAFLFFVALLIVGRGPAQGQSQPTKRVITPRIADGAQDVHAADLDGDGDEDVLFASEEDNKVAWYENTSSGFSTQKVITTSAGGAQSVYAAKLDGDSDLDVLSASSTGDKIAWYENTSGGFSTQKVITTSAGGAQSVYAAKLDGDSDLDVLSASSADDKIAWYEKTSSGFSSQKVITTSAGGAQSVYAAKLDGDSDLDVLSASSTDDKIAWHENTSSGFSAQKVITTSAGGAQSVYAANLDGDSDLDVLAASSTDDKVAWYKNTSSGFSTEKVITTSANGAQSVYAADLDGDSDRDVIVASRDDNEISAYDNQIDANGGFGAELVVSTNPKEVQAVYAADLGGDSHPDVLSASSADDKIAWYENRISNGSGFGIQNVISPSGKVEGIDSVISEDIDSDNDDDIISASGKISVYENLGGKFSAQEVVTGQAGGPSIFVDTVDGDSKPDILSASTGDITWFKNNGGSFSGEHVITTNAKGASSVYSMDIDEDSDTDVVSASEGDFDSDPKIAWYENKGGGTFSSQNVISTDVPIATSVYAADLDGDGDGDVISGSAGSPDKVAWYENTDGQGNFSTQKIISTNTGEVQTVIASDIDDDGDMDVLSASRSDDKVAWYKNTDGDGSFSGQKIISENANGAQDISVADLNGDGDKDVVSVEEASGTNKVRWYEQSTSFGSIAWEEGVVDGLRGAAVHTADLTGNGFQDVIAGLVPNPLDQVVWYENTSSVLPVEMAGIEANRTRGCAVLQWRTASERNNVRFEIQRRVDSPDSDGVKSPSGSNWKEIGFVEGNGTTSQPQTYRFEDSFKRLPFTADTVAYRLRQVDMDGSVSYSKVVRVERSVSHLQIQSTAPNPASQTVIVRYALPNKEEYREATFRIYDALGREVRSVQIDIHSGRQIRRLNVSDLASGTYFLRLSAVGKTVTRKLTVMK